MLRAAAVEVEVGEPIENGRSVDEQADAFYDDRQIAFNLKVMQRASSDERFREQLNKDPKEALENAGLLDEASALAELDAQEGEDVSAHWLEKGTYYRTCRWWVAGIHWHRR